MTIYYNHHYSNQVYHKDISSVTFGTSYYGDSQLLRYLLFQAGICVKEASAEERIAYYHTKASGFSDAGKFSDSLKNDITGSCRAILDWRDKLVSAGWDPRSYKGDSFKLNFIKDLESDEMPKGESDYWNLLLKKSEGGQRLVPDDVAIVSTTRRENMLPVVEKIFAKQIALGAKIEYRDEHGVVADGKLGDIQHIIENRLDKKVEVTKDDKTFSFIQFDNEDEALRYVATLPFEKDTLYYCQNPKRFDNTLRLLGKPACGSLIMSGEPQVIQLFRLGNDLFEYPLNINRIIEWLNMPISPIDGKLRYALSQCLVSTGGIKNEVWNEAVKSYLEDITNEKDRDKAQKNLNDLLPLPENEDVCLEAAKDFNAGLKKWAVGLLSIEDFPYDDVVREQLHQLISYCDSMLRMLDATEFISSYIEYQKLCDGIMQQQSYCQYHAEVGSMNVISKAGDIHDVAEHIVWFPAMDEGAAKYPFDFLNNDEYKGLVGDGVLLYDRAYFSSMNRAAMLRPLMFAKRLTIIEAMKVGGTKVKRHPLVLQLDELIEGKLKNISDKPSLPEEMLVVDKLVNNSISELYVEIKDGSLLKERHERYSDDEVNKQAESYSSLDTLIQHPFEYVCKYCANLREIEAPSADSLNTTLGKVAHLIIEKVFDEKNKDKYECVINEKYDTIFEQAVNECGLLLLRPEYKFDYLNIRRKMKPALLELNKFINDNHLSVVGCEMDMPITEWKEAGDDVKLSSRIDMLLEDANGNKVVFDFKWRDNDGKYEKKSLEESTALQLYLYEYVVRKVYKQDYVKTAYIILPKMITMSHHSFKGIEKHIDKQDVDRMAQLALGYNSRWKQFKDGVIERVEGCDNGTGEYVNLYNVYPLKVNNGKYIENKFGKEYKKLK